jgi:16S rRNA processing protein RimM
VALIPLAQIAGAHGLRGEVALAPGPLGPAELAAVRSFTWRGRDGSERALALADARGSAGRVIARFEGVDLAEQAERLAGGWLLGETDRLPDPGPGVAYRFQLIGFEVVDESGRPLGTLAEIWGTGVHDVLVVRGAREVLVPAVPEFFKSVSMAERRIVVRLIPGMESLAGEPDEAG